MIWDYHNKKMVELKKIYQRVSRQTQNRLQEIFDGIDFGFEDLYSVANARGKKKIDRYIEEWKDKGLLTGYFGMLAKNIYGRTRVKNSEILELLIYGAYVEEQKKLEKPELNVLKDVASYYYEQGQEEVNHTLPNDKKKKVSVIPDAFFLALLEMPNVKGYVWRQYIEAIIKYNADQMYRQCVINIEQSKENKIDDDIFENIIRKQQNAKLCVNGDKISGDVDLTLIGLNNQAKLQGMYSFDEKAKCKFVSVGDEATTKECESLNGQVFLVHDWNEFYRYSKTNGKLMKYRCYGLVTGLNLPPINDGFHWCRSYISYLPPLEKEEKVEYNDLELPTYIRMNIAESYNPQSEVEAINSAIMEMPVNIQRIIRNSSIEIFTRGQITRNGEIIENSFYDRKNDVIHIYQGADKYEVIHEIGHLIETKYDILNDQEYIKIRAKGLENYNANFVRPLDNYTNIIGIKSSKFVSGLQGKIYEMDLQRKSYFDSDQILNLNCLGEYFSEGFREYFESREKIKQVDKELFDYIERKIKDE